MNLLKIFFLKLSFILFSSFIIHAETAIKYYRSNSNGLELLQISAGQSGKYDYILKVQLQNGLAKKKTLYKNNKETKRWDYFYSGIKVNYEKYYKDYELKEDYSYDSAGHIVRKGEYKNKDKIRDTAYQYNSDGLVALEKIFNLINNSETVVKYRYDTQFRIKQIEKKYPDDRIVYWESFFTSKGIIQKEYYTLKDERFIFWYNEYGQEFKGEVIDKNEENDKIKKEWQTFYTKQGRIDRKEEKNYELGLEIKTWYNTNYKEKRIEIYKNDEAVSIELFDYNNNGKIAIYETIKGLNSHKTIYDYDEDDNLEKTFYYENNSLKKEITYKKDGGRIELLYGKNNKKILLEYDADENIINQEIFE